MEIKKLRLNPEQERAVKHETGVMMVLAGAGTGKTRVITERIKRLLQTSKGDEILALTFTEKATGEMAERVEDTIPYQYEEPWIHTFHGFCDRILKAEGLQIGISPNYKIMDKVDQWFLMRRHIYELDLDVLRPVQNPTGLINAALGFIAELKNHEMWPEDVEEFAKTLEDAEERKEYEEIARFYRKYEELKAKQSALDISDLIVLTLKLFKSRANVLEKYRSQFKHILVDEFQDTNVPQYKLIKLLYPQNTRDKNKSLMVVGDDAQAIYSFRGATVQNILTFKRDYPQAQLVTLTRNYRSTQKILDVANRLIEHSETSLAQTLGISRKLESQIDLEPAPAPQAVETPDDDAEAAFVATEIARLVKENEHLIYSDIAILARGNSLLEAFSRRLAIAGIPYQLINNQGLYKQTEIREILAFLRIIVDPIRNQENFNIVLGFPRYNIEPRTRIDIMHQRKQASTDVWEILQQYEHPGVSLLVGDIKTGQEELFKRTASDFLFWIITRTNYIDNLIREETLQSTMKVENINKLLKKVGHLEKFFEQLHGIYPDITQMLEILKESEQAGDNPAQAEIEDINTVKLMTVHGAKGLEFPVVFVVGATNTKFPAKQSHNRGITDSSGLVRKKKSKTEHIEEERRLFYVGLTRAKQFLYVTYALPEHKTRTKPSPFIGEMNLKAVRPFEGLSPRERLEQFGNTSLDIVDQDIPLKDLNTRPQRLSYTQIDTYLTCPRKYKFKYILKMPDRQSHQSTFGTAIHKTLLRFHQLLLVRDVTLEELLQIFSEEWDPAGYMEKAHMEANFKEGERMLRDYYAKVDKTKKPLGLETPFKVKIDDLIVEGRIDRIDPVDTTKDPKEVEIIDYKTGKVKTQKEVNKDLQVSLYALGAQKSLGLNPVKLSFYFLRGNQILSTKRNREREEKLVQLIKDMAKKVEEKEFEPKPGIWCKSCPYRDSCPKALEAGM